MRADRGSAMCIGAAEREIEAALDIGGGPQPLPVRLHGEERAQPRAVRVLLARPDMALVEMGVDVDEGGKDQPGIEVVARADDRRRTRWANGGDATVGDFDIDALDLAIADLAARRARHPSVA